MPAMRLPTPDPAFRWSDEPWGFGLRCRALEPIAQHVFTTRQLQLRHATPAKSIVAAWGEAAAAIGVRLERVARIKQVHGSTVRVIRDTGRGALPQERPPADAVISNQAGLALAVQVADCVPVLLVDAVTGAAGAIHAGWRGTQAGISRGAVQAMRRELGVEPQNLIAAIGPSIGPCCYEVGPEVFDAFRRCATEDQLARWFSTPAPGSLRLDLWTANRDQLIASGIPSDHVFVASLCTRSHLDVFESYRADGENAGRMAALIAVPGNGQTGD
jgi:YfiH family protein